MVTARYGSDRWLRESVEAELHKAGWTMYWADGKWGIYDPQGCCAVENVSSQDLLTIFASFAVSQYVKIGGHREA